jgi:hypothetical protein
MNVYPPPSPPPQIVVNNIIYVLREKLGQLENK